jgi:hypothetical protein
MHECFKTLYKLYLVALDTDLYSDLSDDGENNSYNLQEVVIGFTTGGYPYFITVNDLKSHGIIPPTL